MKDKPNPYHVTGYLIAAGLLLLAGRSDAGAPVWQTVLGVAVCGAVALWAWLRYQRGVVAARQREQTRRRRRA